MFRILFSATCGAGVGVLDGYHGGSRRTKGQPPASLTLKPRLLNSSSKSCRWSPWISITPSFTVPPAPHLALSCLSSSFSCASSPGTPVITVTPLPLRPFVSLPTLTTPHRPRGAALFLTAHTVFGRSAALGTHPPVSGRVDNGVIPFFHLLYRHLVRKAVKIGDLKSISLQL